jgi:hypothetical protein
MNEYAKVSLMCNGHNLGQQTRKNTQTPLNAKSPKSRETEIKQEREEREEPKT